MCQRTCSGRCAVYRSELNQVLPASKHTTIHHSSLYIAFYIVPYIKHFLESHTFVVLFQIQIQIQNNFISYNT